MCFTAFQRTTTEATMRFNDVIFCISLIISGFLLSCNSAGVSPSITADPNTTRETKNLLAGMTSLTLKGIMFGHQDDLAYGIGWTPPDGPSDVFRVCADFPAVFGWDLGHIELGSSHNIDSVAFSDMLTYARKVHAMGAINTYSWHCRNPLTDSSAWYIQEPGVVKSILPGGIMHQKYLEWLDGVAEFFQELTDSTGKPIPVIFRPFHEQSGNWFWWGRAHCTPDEFIRLWQFTVTYLNETKQVHNLLWAFSTADKFRDTAGLLERYPGDAFVDIIGFDIYQQDNQRNEDFAGILEARTAVLAEFSAAHGKLPAITEMGYVQIPYPVWWTEVVWPAVKDYPLSYMLFWRNAINRPDHYYVPYPGQISQDDFIRFYDLPGTLFQKDLAKETIYNNP